MPTIPKEIKPVLTQSEEGFEKILEIASGFMSAKLLFVATEVGLFERLAEGPADLTEIAQRTNLPRYTTRIVIDAMVSLGLIECQKEHYQNGPLADTFLSGRTPSDLRPMMRFWDNLLYSRWLHLESCSRTGQGAPGELTPEQKRLYSEGVQAITMGTANALATVYSFSRHRQLLDLGGGTGSFLMTILRRHSHLACTLFELPPTAAFARERIAASPFAEKIDVVGGDFFKGPLPQNHDAVLLANVLHLFSPANNVILLSRLRSCVPAGTALLLVDLWTDTTHTQPKIAALMAAEFMLATGQGDVYSEEDLREWLGKTAWAPVDRKHLSGPLDLVVAEAV